MRVDENIRKCVVFIGVEFQGNFTPLGTGFLAVRKHEGLEFGFVVTAAHVLDPIPEDGIFCIRVNRKDGGADIVKYRKIDTLIGQQLITASRQSLPAAKPIDLTVFPSGIDGDIYDIASIEISSEARQKFRDEIYLSGPGDEVAIAGVYTSHFGTDKNIPIVRIGHIAAMPDAPVLTDRGYVPGYIIEVHSIAGLSGSPVFLNPPPVRTHDGEFQYRIGPAYYCLGVLLGHHVIETKEDEILVPQFAETSPFEAVGALPQMQQKNTGFGVVVPIEIVFEMLEGGTMTEILSRSVAAHRAKSGVSVSSGLPGPE